MDEDIQQLERDLEAAKRRLEAASAALAPVHKGGEEEEWQAALYACLEIERKLALSKGEEAAMPCEWEIPWDTGAPCPHVLASGRRTILIYLADTFDPDWDGSFVSVIDPKASDPQPLVIVEFAGCYIHKFGGPNDEVFGGLPWEGRGLNAYGAYVIKNSLWLAEMKAVNSVHPYYSESTYSRLKHYVLLFHDEMFECLAERFELERFQGSFADALELARRRLPEA